MSEEMIKIFGKEIYDEMNDIFEICNVDSEEEFLIREIRRKIVDKYSNILSSLNNLINPDSSYLQMFDAQSMSDDDRDVIVLVIRKFGSIVKLNKLLEIKSTIDMEKEFCTKALKTYKDNVESINCIFNKIIKAYANNSKIKNDINYLG